MKRSALIPTAFALATMLAACTDVNAPDASGPLFRHSGDHTVPIKGDFAYSPSGPQVVCVNGFAAPGIVSGPGETSQLGETVFEFTVADCATDFGAATLTINGSFTLTGANGDAIWVGISTGVFDISGVLVGDQFGAFEIVGQITGGTGRFAWATGSVSATGVNDFSIASGTFSLDGTVSSVGSLKQ